MNNKLHIFKVYNLVSFDIHQWNYHHNQDNETPKVSLKVLTCPFPKPLLLQFLSLYISLYFLEFYINGFIQCVHLLVLLLSLSICILTFIHVIACINSSFLFIAELYSIVYHSFLDPPSLFPFWHLPSSFLIVNLLIIETFIITQKGKGTGKKITYRKLWYLK